MFDKSAHKIIFTGPVGSGKSTAINAISDVPRSEERRVGKEC